MLSQVASLWISSKLEESNEVVYDHRLASAENFAWITRDRYALEEVALLLYTFPSHVVRTGRQYGALHTERSQVPSRNPDCV